MTYTVYATGDCSGTAFANAGTFNVVNGTVAASSLVAFPAAGTYSWNLAYSGDANYAAVSRCAPLTVTKVAPSLSLSVSPTKNPMRAGGTAVGTATLSGATAAAGGTVTYTVYSNSACSTQLTVTNNPSTVVVTNAAVPTSAAISMDVAGTVYWQAVYSGDANNNAATSTCVSLSVTKSRPKLALVVSSAVSPMVAGSTATGTATLTRATSTASGTVTYTVYTASNCTTPLSATNNPSTVTVTNRTVPASAAITFNQTGTFYWRASYSGDAGNSSATSGCLALTVAKATPSLTLTVNPTASPMVAGGTARGAATLTGSTATAGGTVTYTVYSDSGCTTQLSTINNPSTASVTNNVVPNSAAITLAQAGTVYWQVIYSGDANNNGAASGCLALTVARTTPRLSLTVNPTVSPMVVGGTASGAASLASATSTAGGSVTYTVYTNNSCSVPTVPSQQSTKSVALGVVPPSDLFTFNQAGVVFWQAVYSGDANNNSATSGCVALTITSPGTPTVSLTVSPNPITVGATATGNATLTGVTATAGGTVTFTVYTDTGCTTAMTPALTSTKTVTNGTVPNSGPFTFSQAGTFYWKAVYSGDALNAGVASPCVPLAVNKASPTITLSMSPNPVGAGRTVTGTATLTNGVGSPGGTATYTVFTNNTCTTPVTPALTSTKTVTNGIVPNSDALAFNRAGTFYWQVSYSGDANNSPVASQCVALSVTKATPSLSMVQVPSPLNLGDSFTAHLTLSASAISPTGTVTIRSYSDAGCTTAQSGLDPVTVTLVNGQIPDPPAVVYNFTGDVYRQATYSGDANNAATTTGCQLVVVAQDLPLSLTLSPATTVLHGTSVSAQAAWPSDETPTGTVTYTAYATADCSGTVFAGPQTRTITANSVAASSAVTFDAGAYSWKGAYSGDDAYNSTSVCVPLTVLKSTPALSLVVAPSPAIAGGAVTATATLTGAANTASGTVAYAVYTDSGCTQTMSGVNPGTKAVTNGSVPSSAPVSFPQGGTFYWQAVYSGDANDAAATSSCVALIVQPTISLTMSTTAVSFGTVSSGGQAPNVPGVTVTTDPGGANYIVTGAVTVTVSSSNSGWTGTCRASENSGTSSLTVSSGALSWQMSDGTTSWTAFSTSSSGSTACFPTNAAGTTSYTYDYKLRVTRTDTPGTLNSTVTYRVSE